MTSKDRESSPCETGESMAILLRRSGVLPCISRCGVKAPIQEDAVFPRAHPAQQCRFDMRRARLVKKLRTHVRLERECSSPSPPLLLCETTAQRAADLLQTRLVGLKCRLPLGRAPSRGVDGVLSKGKRRDGLIRERLGRGDYRACILRLWVVLAESVETCCWCRW